MALIEEAQTANYYKQISLELATQQGWDFPGAIYIDAVDHDGVIRTGTREIPMPGDYSSQVSADHSTTSYAYADTLILANLRRLCGSSLDATEECIQLNKTIEARRSKHPYQRWSDLETGRSADWPTLPFRIE